MREIVTFLVKWGLLVALIAVAFYLVCPKYRIVAVSTPPSTVPGVTEQAHIGAFRINIFTGETKYIPRH
jgi:hypothetical protein